ncbi:MAG: methyltransferase domain-containing protein [Armatimonadota bacterium]|nr:methyltransferase domain-containing protein [Armatimonadota bacterium]
MGENKNVTATTQFTEISRHYDELMAGVPYRLWVEYVEDILRRINYHPSNVLDAACGTGNASEILAEFGYKVTGVDISPGMIEVAKVKTRMLGEVEYLVQDLAEMYLNRKFDLIVCVFDSLNYITDPDRLQMAIERVSEHLVPDGVFIFDVNTPYALSHGFFNQSNLGSRKYPKYVWSCAYDRPTRICTVTMVFEVLEGKEKRQFTEMHHQRAYEIDELREMVAKAGMQVIDTFHAYTFKKPNRRSDRVFFVARKPSDM